MLMGCDRDSERAFAVLAKSHSWKLEEVQHELLEKRCE